MAKKETSKAAPAKGPVADKADSKPDHQDASAEQGVFHLRSQYIRDLSFECPQASVSLGEHQNNIQFDVAAQTRRVGDDFELCLTLKGTNKTEKDQLIYLLELQYCGLFTIQGLPNEQVEMILGIDAPSLMYPFARQIFMNTIASSGFRPPMLDPINFAALFMQAKQRGASPLPPVPASAGAH